MGHQTGHSPRFSGNGPSTYIGHANLLELGKLLLTPEGPDYRLRMPDFAELTLESATLEVLSSYFLLEAVTSFGLPP